jgi:hypothetical protein
VGDHWLFTTTSDDGIPVASDGHSFPAGQDGPMLLLDHYPIEVSANFNRKRIPERQAHAKGPARPATSKMDDVSQYTSGAVFQPRTRTETVLRFNTSEGDLAELVSNVIGHLLVGVSEPVLERAIQYWKNRPGHRRAHRKGDRPGQARTFLHGNRARHGLAAVLGSSFSGSQMRMI